ncbi:hypothetical protein F5Y16DRAFT_222267 [Xylariaceae sp. FL0255]|nr:hypothetical protein F5Y16DRAFT_222267 [Xylariaceae sp. FL0255]
MAHAPALHDVVGEVIAASKEVDEHILRTNWMKDYTAARIENDYGFAFDLGDSEVYLENLNNVRLWDRYFEYILNEWDSDIDGDRMSEARFNYIIERLTAPASALDLYGSQLVTMYQSVPNVPEKRIQGIIRRRTVLNSFLNSAEIALFNWYKSEDRLENRTLRQRRPVPDAKGRAPLLAKSDSGHDFAANKEMQHATSTHRVEGWDAFTSRSTLIAVTVLITVGSTILSAYGFAIASYSEPSYHSADFFNTLQSSLMQLLGLYVTVQPAVRHNVVSSSYHRWSWGLSALGAVSPCLAIGTYRINPAISQLVLFLGSALQSVVVLELLWAVDDLVESRQVKEKPHRY